jgi:hypothetical protein
MTALTSFRSPLEGELSRAQRVTEGDSTRDGRQSINRCRPSHARIAPTASAALSGWPK